MNLGAIFNEVSKKMYSDLEMARASISHPGMKGGSAEATFRGFLKNYLPKNLDVSTGILVDAQGESSRQLDVIISDSPKTPIFYEKDEQRVIPVECAYAVIEVKTTLNKKELENSFENMKSVRKLKKTAYTCKTGPIKHFHKIYGKEWEIWPINYFIFAYESINLQTLSKQVRHIHKKENLPLNSRIDTICVLNGGVICNLDINGQLSALPDEGSKLVYVNSENSLLLFYALIMHYMNQTELLPNFNFTDYLGNIDLGNITIPK